MHILEQPRLMGEKMGFLSHQPELFTMAPYQKFSKFPLTNPSQSPPPSRGETENKTAKMLNGLGIRVYPHPYSSPDLISDPNGLGYEDKSGPVCNFTPIQRSDIWAYTIWHYKPVGLNNSPQIFIVPQDYYASLGFPPSLTFKQVWQFRDRWDLIALVEWKADLILNFNNGLRKTPQEQCGIVPLNWQIILSEDFHRELKAYLVALQMEPLEVIKAFRRRRIEQNWMVMSFAMHHLDEVEHCF